MPAIKELNTLGGNATGLRRGLMLPLSHNDDCQFRRRSLCVSTSLHEFEYRLWDIPVKSACLCLTKRATYLPLTARISTFRTRSYSPSETPSRKMIMLRGSPGPFPRTVVNLARATLNMARRSAMASSLGSCSPTSALYFVACRSML